jgi:hypothetical protein
VVLNWFEELKQKLAERRRAKSSAPPGLACENSRPAFLRRYNPRAGSASQHGHASSEDSTTSRTRASDWCVVLNWVDELEGKFAPDNNVR